MKILVFGDSLADGIVVGDAKQCETVSRWGETTTTLVSTFPNLQYYLSKETYDIVILIAGTNDMANDAIPNYAVQNLIRMHQLCRKRGVFCSIAVSIMHDLFNNYYQKECDSSIPMCCFLHEDIDSIYLEDDGIHLNKEGKKQFQLQLEKTILDAILTKIIGINMNELIKSFF